MNVKCSCGGKFKRCDLVQEVRNGRVVCVDYNVRVATWDCGMCGAVRFQRKRQASWPVGSGPQRLPRDRSHGIEVKK